MTEVVADLADATGRIVGRRRRLEFGVADRSDASVPVVTGQGDPVDGIGGLDQMAGEVTLVDSRAMQRVLDGRDVAVAVVGSPGLVAEGVADDAKPTGVVVGVLRDAGGGVVVVAV